MSLIRRSYARKFPSASLGLTLALVFGFHYPETAHAQAPRSKTVELDSGAPDAKRDDPQARALFDQVSKAYKQLSSYSDQGQFVVAMTAAGKADKQVVPLKVTLVRPNKFEVDTNVVKLTSDGKTLTTSVVPLKKYTAVPAPEKVDIETFREGPIGAALFGGPSGVPMFVLLNLLTAPDPGAAIAQIGGSLKLVAGSGPKAEGAKDDASALLIDLGKGAPGVLLTIDPATKLLSSIDLKLAPETLKAQNVSIEKLGWSSGAVSTEVAKDRSFAFEAPKGFAKVDTLLEKQGEAPANSSKIGKPAPDFTLTLLDGPGKTKTVTRAELAGKVVVIDFWATWCKPCLMELPEIQKLVESYADTKKEVLVVALSQDEEPSDVTQLRTLVEKTLADKKINLTTNPVGRIGLDPSKSVGTAFELEDYPTLVILDGKGIVQSVHVGFNPEAAEPLSKSLAKEIDTLLEGKSLTGPKAHAEDASKKSDKQKP
jgi:thiol-disulfide isomerase/thioredoxin